MEQSPAWLDRLVLATAERRRKKAAEAAFFDLHLLKS